jgi:hypothetical protein
MAKRPSFFKSLGLGGVCLIALSGCTAMVDGKKGETNGTPSGGGAGSIGDPSVPGGGAATTVPGGGAPAACDNSASLAPARIWRITDDEYINAVAAVFGVKLPTGITAVAVATPDYNNSSEGNAKVDLSIGQGYQTAAHAAAQQAVTSHLSTFLSCGLQAPSDACVEEFIKKRVSRAFGRPVTDEETQDLMTVYKTSGVDGPSVGIRLIIEAVLQSSSFIYRTELGPVVNGGPTAKVTLTPYEIATAMSFALLDAPPDDALWNAAEDNSLSKPEVVAAQVERMLALPAVQANLSDKAAYWLGIQKLKTVQKSTDVYPMYTSQVQADLYTSGQLFVQNLLATGTVKDMLTSKRMYLNESLAKIYGVSGVTGTNFVPVDVTLPERANGILSQPAAMAASDNHGDRTDVVHRGLYIYYSFVCGSSVGKPPDNATTVDASLPAGTSERARSTFRTTAPASLGCAVCHGRLDAFGLSTERYDSIGRYSAVDATGAPIDSTATVSAGVGADLAGPITGLNDVATRLANAGRRVSDCAAANLAVVALGHDFTADTSCAMSAVKDKFATTGSFSDFYRALLNSPGFITRDPAPAPVSAPAGQ